MSNHLLLQNNKLVTYLSWKQLPHIAISISSMQRELSVAGLRSRGAALSFGWAVDLVVYIFTGVHVEAGVQEGAVSKALVCVLVDDPPGEVR